MPIFEFKCRDCGKEFDILVSNSEKAGVRCPECESHNTKQLLSLFNTGTRNKTSSLSHSTCDSCAVNSG